MRRHPREWVSDSVTGWQKQMGWTDTGCMASNARQLWVTKIKWDELINWKHCQSLRVSLPPTTPGDRKRWDYTTGRAERRPMFFPEAAGFETDFFDKAVMINGTLTCVRYNIFQSKRFAFELLFWTSWFLDLRNLSDNYRVGIRYFDIYAKSRYLSYIYDKLS